jgi:hypothetical protein
MGFGIRVNATSHSIQFVIRSVLCPLKSIGPDKLIQKTNSSGDFLEYIVFIYCVLPDPLGQRRYSAPLFYIDLKV